MNKVRTLDTHLVYPLYEEIEAIEILPGNDIFPSRKAFHVHMMTHVRKKHGRRWYLIPIRLNIENVLQEDGHEEIQKAECRRKIELQFQDAVYKTLLFYIVRNSMAMIDSQFGRPIIFQDADQRSEEERLGMNIK